MTNPYYLPTCEHIDLDEILIFVTPWIKHNVHGIPKISEKYYSTKYG
jgi:hypothetical protein